ncbi:hypothetical protein SOVF_207190, partial [Spinacia oleracea]
EIYEKKLAECREKGIDKDLNQIYFETVGGRKKGKVPGLGSGAHLYYARSSRRGGSSSSRYSPSIFSQLTTRLEESQRQLSQQSIELERQRTQIETERLEIERERLQMLKEREENRLQMIKEREEERLQMIKEREEEQLQAQREREEDSRRNAEHLAEMKRAMEYYAKMLSQCGGSFPFTQQQDPRDPSGGGAPCSS